MLLNLTINQLNRFQLAPRAYLVGTTKVPRRAERVPCLAGSKLRYLCHFKDFIRHAARALGSNLTFVLFFQQLTPLGTRAGTCFLGPLLCFFIDLTFEIIRRGLNHRLKLTTSALPTINDHTFDIAKKKRGLG